MKQEVIDRIQKEYEAQLTRWGRQGHSVLHWLAILGEEYGEACQAGVEQVAAYGSHRPVVYLGPVDEKSLGEFWSSLKGKEADLAKGQREEALRWRKRFQEEIVQVAAVCVAILEQMEEGT